VKAVEYFVGRIEERNPSLNAFVHQGFDEARERAVDAERRLGTGEELGPLHGVPTAMKDLFDFKPGWPATFGGIPALRDNTTDFGCMWVERMEAAGAIILGKTNSPVMGFRGTCDNPLFGPTRNPFDTTHNSGGSSGGSSAAVADGLVPFAEATNGGGSARIPASWCGLVGYKQSWGRTPLVMRPNAFGGTAPLLFEGLVTRTVEDAALGLTALSGPDPRDPLRPARRGGRHGLDSPGGYAACGSPTAPTSVASRSILGWRRWRPTRWTRWTRWTRLVRRSKSWN